MYIHIPHDHRQQELSKKITRFLFPSVSPQRYIQKNVNEKIVNEKVVLRKEKKTN